MGVEHSRPEAYKGSTRKLAAKRIALGAAAVLGAVTFGCGEENETLETPNPVIRTSESLTPNSITYTPTLRPFVTETPLPTVEISEGAIDYQNYVQFLSTDPNIVFEKIIAADSQKVYGRLRKVLLT